MHRLWIAISQVKAPFYASPGNTIPSLSPRHTQAMRCFAQVIHMVMHSQPTRPRPSHDRIRPRAVTERGTSEVDERSAGDVGEYGRHRAGAVRSEKGRGVRHFG